MPVSSAVYYLNSNIFRGMGENTFQLCSYILARNERLALPSGILAKVKIAGWDREEKNLVGAAVSAINWLHILRLPLSFSLSFSFYKFGMVMASSIVKY